MSDESELLEQWQRGDSRAGERLVQMNFEPLLRFVRSKIDDRSAVDDIVQETWTAVLVQHKELNISTTFRRYLLGIAAHKVFKCLRVRLGAREIELPSMSIEQLAPSLGGVIDVKRQHKLLIAALRSLPLEQQVILELYVWEEMHTRDIAEILGLTIAQIKHRIREGKDRLERYIHGAGHTPGPGDTQEVAAWVHALRERANPNAERAESSP